MPVVTANQYDTAEQILELARSISNDASTSNGLAGDILADSQPYTFPILAKCYRDLQDDLITGGVETFSKYGHIYGVLPTQAQNPRTNVTISFIGYWNGQITNPAIKLPPNMIKPLELWQCPSGNFFWGSMRQVPDSISSRNPAPLPGVWDFENDVLILPGSTQSYDIKMKYLLYAPDLTGPTSQVYIQHAQTALANLVVADVSEMLGGLDVATFKDNAKKAIDKIINRTARKEQYSSFQRIPFRGRGIGRSQGWQ